MPSKHRNVTSLYLDFFGKGGMLLDCGEGSLGQLRRCGQGRNRARVALDCSVAVLTCQPRRRWPRVQAVRSRGRRGASALAALRLGVAHPRRPPRGPASRAGGARAAAGATCAAHPSGGSLPTAPRAFRVRQGVAAGLRVGGPVRPDAARGGRGARRGVRLGPPQRRQACRGAHRRRQGCAGADHAAFGAPRSVHHALTPAPQALAACLAWAAECTSGRL